MGCGVWYAWRGMAPRDPAEYSEDRFGCGGVGDWHGAVVPAHVGRAGLGLSYTKLGVWTRAESGFGWGNWRLGVAGRDGLAVGTS